jgi:hypothetical protein
VPDACTGSVQWITRVALESRPRVEEQEKWWLRSELRNTDSS